MSTRTRDLYEEDFFAWTQLQAKEIRRFARSRSNLPLDLGHIAEEIADLGQEQRNALRSWTARTLEHLLRLEHSPATEPCRGWIDEIINFRSEIEARLTPTLRRDPTRQLPQPLRARPAQSGEKARAVRGRRYRRAHAGTIPLDAGPGSGRLLAAQHRMNGPVAHQPSSGRSFARTVSKVLTEAVSIRDASRARQSMLRR